MFGRGHVRAALALILRIHANHARALWAGGGSAKFKKAATERGGGVEGQFAATTDRSPVCLTN